MPVRIKMLSDATASPDGVTLKPYVKGETYEVRDRLAEILVDQMKVARRVRSDAGLPRGEKQDVDYENKMEPPGEDKAARSRAKK